MNTSNKQASGRSETGPVLAWIALLLGLACVAAVLLAALGYRTETLSLGAAIQSIR